MKKYSVDSLAPGMAFTKNVYIGNNNLLVNAKMPLKVKDIERLHNWNITEVESEGEPIETKMNITLGKKDFPDVTKLYKNIIENKKKVEETYVDILNKLRLILTKIKSSNYLDDSKLSEVIDVLIHEVQKRKPLYLTQILGGVHNDYLYSHALNTTIVSLIMGIELRFPQEKLSELAKAALLHNVGMLLLPILITTSSSKFSKEEFLIIKKHPLLGYKVLYNDLKTSIKVADAALSHHENFDGTGYPRGLQGYDIEEYPRIIAFGDMYSSLIVDKEYRKKFKPYFALREIMALNNVKFDPNLMQVFVSSFSLYPVGTFVRLNNNVIGVVVDCNDGNKLRPVVKMLFNQNSDNVSDKNVIINLLDEKKIFIKEVIVDEDLEKKVQNEI